MSRRERNKQNAKVNRSENDSGVSKVYYIVIGLLFVILIGLIIFIFNRGGDVNLDENDNDTPTEDVSTDQPTDTEEPEDTEDSNTDESSPVDETPAEDNETSEESNADEGSEENVQNQDQTTDTPGTNNSEVVTENAPHDPSHAVNYDSGSTDRIAIKNQIMQATGLGSDLTEWWIGNDGPGRVKATVSDNANTTYYDVYLQYGDGNWHVTSFQEVSGN